MIDNIVNNTSKVLCNRTKCFFVLLLIYLALTLWCTVFVRTERVLPPRLELFLSYKKWIAGNWSSGMEILLNIGMFIPFGFLFSAWLSLRKNQCGKVLLAAILFSCFIEVLQLELVRGMFEIDDIFNNTLGSVLGYLIYRFLHKLVPAKYEGLVLLLLGALFVVIGIIVGVRISKTW